MKGYGWLVDVRRQPSARSCHPDPRLEVRSAGTSQKARRVVSATDLHWADVVLVMEAKHKQRIQGTFGRLTADLPIIILDIPDEFQPMDPELVELLRAAVPSALSPWALATP